MTSNFAEREIFPFVKTLSLEGNATIELEPGAVVAIVGPNNSGKTHLLNVLTATLLNQEFRDTLPNSSPLKEVQVAWNKPTSELSNELLVRLERQYKRTSSGSFEIPKSEITNLGSPLIHMSSINRNISLTTTLSELAPIFCRYDEPLKRAVESELKTQVPQRYSTEIPLTQMALHQEETFQLISSYFKKIFNENLSFYDKDGQIGFIIGDTNITASTRGNAYSSADLAYLRDARKLWNQGMGMRSVVGLLMRIFVDEKNIIICDEPEAFLHPPQALKLGFVLSDIAKKFSKQFFLATHDRNLISGIVESNLDSTHIVKLSINSPTSREVAPISAREISEAKRRSLIRFTPLLDCLFYRATLLCENESDALCYSIALSNLDLTGDPHELETIIDELTFLGIGGKSEMSSTASIIKSLQSQPIIIADFDFIRQKGQLQQYLSTLKIDPSPFLALWDTIANLICEHEPSIIRRESFKVFKKKGIYYNEAPVKSEVIQLLNRLEEHGICLLHVGELEDLAPVLYATVGKAKWPHEAIESGVFKSDHAIFHAQRILGIMNNQPTEWDKAPIQSPTL